MQRTRLLVHTALIALSVLFGAHAHASEGQTPAGVMMPGEGGTALTRDSVGRLLDSYTELVEAFKDYEGGTDAGGLADYVQANSAQNKANAIVTGHGFENWVDWYQHFLPAIRAYTTLKTQNAQAGQAQLAGQIEQIRNNPDLTEAQKQQMLSMIQASQGMMKSMTNADPADVEAVRPHMDRFEKVLNESDR